MSNPTRYVALRRLDAEPRLPTFSDSRVVGFGALPVAAGTFSPLVEGSCLKAGSCNM